MQCKAYSSVTVLSFWKGLKVKTPGFGEGATLNIELLVKSSLMKLPATCDKVVGFSDGRDEDSEELDDSEALVSEEDSMDALLERFLRAFFSFLLSFLICFRVF